MTREYKTKEYHKLKAKEHYWTHKEEYHIRNQLQKQRTRQIIADVKAIGCRLCDEKESSALDFHHVHGKDRVISQMHGMNDDRVRAEIAKCVILCANCHRKVHAGILSIA